MLDYFVQNQIQGQFERRLSTAMGRQRTRHFRYVAGISCGNHLAHMGG